MEAVFCHQSPKNLFTQVQYQEIIEKESLSITRILY